MALVYVVAEEKVIVGVDVTRLLGRFPYVEEAHQIDVLAVDITKYF